MEREGEKSLLSHKLHSAAAADVVFIVRTFFASFFLAVVFLTNERENMAKGERERERGNIILLSAVAVSFADEQIMMAKVLSSSSSGNCAKTLLFIGNAPACL